MENKSLDAFSFQLEKILRDYESFSKMSEDLEIPQSTIKSWLSKRRSPKLDSLDFLANKIGCYSYELLTYEDISRLEIDSNDSRNAFVKNLNKIFIEKYCHTHLQKYTLLSNVISNDTLISYLRNENYRKPTLEVLDKIANELSIQTYLLIKEETQ